MKNGDELVDAIISLAQRLGREIAESAAAKALRAAQEAVDGQPELKKLLEDYRVQSQKMMELRESGKPIEVSDKHRVQELQSKLAGSEVFKKLTGAQVEYVDMLRKVNDAMRKELAATERHVA